MLHVIQEKQIGIHAPVQDPLIISCEQNGSAMASDIQKESNFSGTLLIDHDGYLVFISEGKHHQAGFH